MPSSYHVYFSAREGVSNSDLIFQVHAFMREQVETNLSVGYRLLQMTNKASFPQLPDFHLIVDYATESDLQLAFSHMKPNHMKAPHAPLMSMVSPFYVAFSADT